MYIVVLSHRGLGREGWPLARVAMYGGNTVYFSATIVLHCH